MSELTVEERLEKLETAFMALLGTPTGEKFLTEYRLQRIVDEETSEHPWFKAWMAANSSS